MSVSSLFIAVLLGILFQASVGLVIRESFNTNNKDIPVQGFGFLRDGTIDLYFDVKTPDKNQWFIGCTQTEYVQLFNFGYDYCSVISNASCTLSVQLSSQNITISKLSITRYGVYYFDLLNCGPNPIQADLFLTLLNPEGEHLGYGYIPLPPMHMILVGVWTLSLAVWCFNWIKNRKQKIKLNQVISVFPVIKIAFAAVAILYWKTLSVNGYVPRSYLLSYGFLYIAAEAIFYAVLMIIATGWGTAKDRFGYSKSIIAGVIIGLVASRLLGFLLHGLFFLLTYILYVVILVIIFRFINKNIHELQVEIRNNPRPVDDADQANRSAQIAKDKMLHFKIVMIGYVALIMMSALFELLFLRDYAWIAEMIREMIELCMFMAYGYTLRLRALYNYDRLGDDSHPAYYNEPVEMHPPQQQQNTQPTVVQLAN